MFTKGKYNMISELTSYNNNNKYAYHYIYIYVYIYIYIYIYIVMYVRFMKNQITFQFCYFFE